MLKILYLLVNFGIFKIIFSIFICFIFVCLPYIYQSIISVASESYAFQCDVTIRTLAEAAYRAGAFDRYGVASKTLLQLV